MVLAWVVLRCVRIETPARTLDLLHLASHPDRAAAFTIAVEPSLCELVGYHGDITPSVMGEIFAAAGDA